MIACNREMRCVVGIGTWDDVGRHELHRQLFDSRMGR